MTTKNTNEELIDEEVIEKPIDEETPEVPTEPTDPEVPVEPEPEPEVKPEPKPSLFILYMNEGQFEIKDKNNLEIIEEDVWDSEKGTMVKYKREIVLNPFRIAKAQGTQDEVQFETELEALRYALDKFKDQHLEKLRRDYFTDIIYR